MAGGVTVLYEGLVGRGVIGALVVLVVCFVGMVTCLETGLEVLGVVGLNGVDFEGLILAIVLGRTLTDCVLGLDGVALDGVTFVLGGGFTVVGCGFFGTAPWSDRAESGFVLEGFVVAGIVFFLLSVPAIVFFERL